MFISKQAAQNPEGSRPLQGYQSFHQEPSAVLQTSGSYETANTVPTLGSFEKHVVIEYTAK